MAKHAVIVVDLQNDYLPTGKYALEGIQAAVANAAAVIEHARAKEQPVICVQHLATGADAPFFVPGTPGVEFIPEVAPRAGDPIVVKHHPNAFLATELRPLLDELSVTDVTIVGAMSHMCIEATARAASDFGYKVTVVHDACATRDLEFDGGTVAAAQVHAASMASLAFAYARLIAADRYLAV